MTLNFDLEQARSEYQKIQAKIDNIVVLLDELEVKKEDLERRWADLEETQLRILAEVPEGVELWERLK